mmetsp:Transcript_107393/g.208067  ORF Transcript_107393/g.208067 Transcript_107393/m.208067 type:complete len:118 (-) Transcript_107393:110-463(-)
MQDMETKDIKGIMGLEPFLELLKKPRLTADDIKACICYWAIGDKLVGRPPAIVKVKSKWCYVLVYVLKHRLHNGFSRIFSLHFDQDVLVRDRKMCVFDVNGDVGCNRRADQYVSSTM